MRRAVPLLFDRFHGYAAGPREVPGRENEAQEPPAPLLPARYGPRLLRPRLGPCTLALGGSAAEEGSGVPLGVILVGQEAGRFPAWAAQSFRCWTLFLNTFKMTLLGSLSTFNYLVMMLSV